MKTTDSSALLRFLDKTEKLPDGCWRWLGTMSPQGYGHFWCNGSNTTAHRAAYELFIGPITDGLHTDHLCRNRWCVNPRHIDLVTPAENNRRGVRDNPWQKSKTHCPRGHPYEGDNLVIGKSGSRFCRDCGRIAASEAYQRKKSTATPGPGKGTYWANKTHCPQGHEYTPENTYVNPKGGRVCRTCKAERAKGAAWATSDHSRAYKTEWARQNRQKT